MKCKIKAMLLITLIYCTGMTSGCMMRTATHERAMHTADGQAEAVLQRLLTCRDISIQIRDLATGLLVNQTLGLVTGKYMIEVVNQDGITNSFEVGVR